MKRTSKKGTRLIGKGQISNRYSLGKGLDRSEVVIQGWYDLLRSWRTIKESVK